MKDSNIIWIGSIPEHWQIKRYKFLYKSNMGSTILKEDLVEGGSIPVYSATESDTIFGYVNETSVLLDEGDIVIPARGNSIGHIMIVREKATSTQTTIYSKPITEEIHSEFIKYYLKGLREHLFQFDQTAIPQITVAQVKEKPVLIPTSNEQIKIAKYLDDKTAFIDNVIKLKYSLIEKLLEKRVVVINEAITKGLNSKAKLKPSGLQTFGSVPNHWNIKRIKHICKIQGRIGFKGYKSADLVNEGEGAITLGATHITRGHKIDLTEPIYLNWDKYYESPEIMVKKGDVVFTQRGAYLGKVALIDADYGEITINPSLILLKNISIDSGYLTYYLTTKYIRESIEIISNSTAIPMISQEQLANFYILVPPIEEQTEIFNYIISENEKSDKAISKIESEIELLKEFKSALIKEVVTGKIKLN